jgi:hypothetical protein
MSSKKYAKQVAKWYQESYPLVACFQLYFLLTGVRHIVQIDPHTKRDFQKIRSLLNKHFDLFSYIITEHPKFHHLQLIITRVNNAHLLEKESETSYAKALNKDFYVCAAEKIPRNRDILRISIVVVLENQSGYAELLAQQCFYKIFLKSSKKNILSVWKAYQRYQKEIQILLEACHLKGNSMLKFVYGKHDTYV